MHVRQTANTMKDSEEILAEVKDILATKWKRRDGRKVPEPDDITMANDAVELEGTVLYADMADSTGLVDSYKDHFAAEVYKAYLVAACHLIRNNSGTITAFDGDRVMGVYYGERKNSNAAKTSLQLNWAVKEINAAIKLEYQNTAYQLRHSVGIDTSKLFVAKTGIRDSNDLVWVGKAANYAAKMAALPLGANRAIITEAVFNVLSEETKNGGVPRRCMWDKLNWPERNVSIYTSSWQWTP